jgi:hypothetical protein
MRCEQLLLICIETDEGWEEGDSAGGKVEDVVGESLKEVEEFWGR